MPVPEDLNNDTEYPAFQVQFSAIEGGTILTFCQSHVIADGNGMDELMRVLFSEIRRAQDGNASAASPGAHELIGMDRSLLRDVGSDPTFSITQHPAYRWKDAGPQAEASISTERHPYAPTKPELPIVFRISATKLAQLKIDATTPDTPRPISTHDAIVALIWRSIILVRSRRTPNTNLDPTTTTSWFMPMDARRILNLPADYIGNAVYQLTANIPLGTLLDPSSGLRAAAAAVRAVISFVTKERVSSYFNFINHGSPSSVANLGWAFETGNLDTTGVAMGTCFGSSVLYSHLGEAFGDTVSFRMVGEEGGGGEVLPRLTDGSAEIVVGVMDGEEAVLRNEECLGKYIAI